MIYDCFTFFNELDLLELRLKELSPVVDHFVLVESPMTFSGLDKPLFFRENQQRFTQWRKKIIHIVVNDPDTGRNPWVREEQQRNLIVTGLTGAKDDDLILISDMDEIPSQEMLLRCNDWMAHLGQLVHLSQKHFLYYINLRRFLDWHMAVALPMKLLRQGLLPHGARMTSIKFGFLVPDAGWHFAYMGGLNKVITKMESFSHALEKQCDDLRMRYRKGLLTPEQNDADQLRKVQIDNSYPESIQTNLGWWEERGYLK